MSEIIIRRLSFMLVTMLLVSLAVFFISEVVPVDPARNFLGQFATPETIAAFREQYGFNCPATARYFIWLIGDDWIPPVRTVMGEGLLPTGCTPEPLDRKGLLRGDLGYSLQTGSAVAPLMLRRATNSLILAGIAFVLIMPVSLLFGLWAGLEENKLADRVITLTSLITTSTPSFALGVLLVVIFGIRLKWLPGISALTTEATILQNPLKLVMPIAVLFFAEAGYVARMTRASMVEVMATPYMRTAVLKGLSYRQVVFKHALKNALLAPITVILLHISWLIGGIVVVETLFGFPGLGSLLLQASLNKDVAVIEAGALFMVFIAMVTQLAADFVYIYLNPRIRYS
jgi:peptide/nickel transport system permease protein